MKLYSYVTTHNNFDEGGRKVHICNDLHRTLCGYGNLHSLPLPINLDWIQQPDPDNNLCKKCKKAAVKALN